MGDYPDNWHWIAMRIKNRAGWCCEHCGHPDESETGHTLTVHHIDGDKSNCADDNLVALCQRCHLHIQARFIVGQIVMQFALTDWMESRGLGQ